MKIWCVKGMCMLKVVSSEKKKLGVKGVYSERGYYHWVPNLYFVPYSNVFLTQASGIFLLGVLLCNWAVEHNMAMFSKLYTTKESLQRLVLGVRVITPI